MRPKKVFGFACKCKSLAIHIAVGTAQELSLCEGFLEFIEVMACEKKLYLSVLFLSTSLAPTMPCPDVSCFCINDCVKFKKH